MSTLDTMTPIVAAPWLDTQGRPLSIRPWPGLRSQTIQGLERTYPGSIGPALKELNGMCCGLSGTVLGNIDFTGCLFPPEPCAVFQPCMTLAHESDEEIRGWLASLPCDAYVYDLRSATPARGWPYGVAGPSGRLFRCGRLPVFAVAGSPTEGWLARNPEAINPGPRYGATVIALAPRARSRKRSLAPLAGAHESDLPQCA